MERLRIDATAARRSIIRNARGATESLPALLHHILNSLSILCIALNGARTTAQAIQHLAVLQILDEARIQNFDLERTLARLQLGGAGHVGRSRRKYT